MRKCGLVVKAAVRIAFKLICFALAIVHHTCMPALFWLVTTFIAFASLPSMPSENEDDRKANEKKAFTGMLARWTREISKSSQRRTEGVLRSRRLQRSVYFRHEFSATWRRGAARVHLIHRPTQCRRHKPKTQAERRRLVKNKSWCGSGTGGVERKNNKKYCVHSPPQRGIQAP